MSFLAPIVGGVSSVIGGLLGSNSAQNAAGQLVAGTQQAAQPIIAAAQQGQAGVGTNVGNAQQWAGGAADAANQQIGQNAGQILSSFNPYTQAGSAATGALQNMAGANSPLAQQFSFNPSNLASDPGYQFTLQQGQQAIQKASAAQGGLFSSGTLKSLAGYTTGSANQYFNDAYNRSLSTFNTNRQGALAQAGILQGLSGQGLSATGAGAGALQTAGLAQGQNLTNAAQYAGNTGLAGAEFGANLGTGAAQQQANLLLQAANARAGGTVGATNSWLTALGQGTNALTGWLSGQQMGKGASPSLAGTGAVYGPQTGNLSYNPALGGP